MKAQRFKAVLVTGNWPDNPEPLMRSEAGEYVNYSDLAEALRQRDEARREAEECRNAMGSKRIFPWENNEEQEAR